MDLPTFTTGAEAARHGFQLVKGLMDAKKTVEENRTAIEFQNVILYLQNALAEAREENDAITKKKRDLEEELMKVSKWEDESRDYQLQEFRPNLFLRRREPSGDEEDASHWACPNCFLDKAISPLQQTDVSKQEISCHRCGFSFNPETEEERRAKAARYSAKAREMNKKRRGSRGYDT